MKDIDTTRAIDLPIFHPAARYNTPDDVINDPPPRGGAEIRLRRPEKAAVAFGRLSS